jgi:phosphoglucomutase
LADGIVITPSHNPPDDGGFKYNPPHGGPADSGITKFIQDLANTLLEGKLAGVKRIPPDAAMRSATIQRHDFIGEYVSGLGTVIDMDLLRESGIKMGVDPLGGAGVHYWAPIAERYGLNLEVVNKTVDPTFRFMTRDWDGKIRMDPSSQYAMRGLIGLKDRFDIAFACDTDHDRHGIVTPGEGLMPPNQYLSVAVDYLLRHRGRWDAKAAVGKTVVTSAMIDRVAARLARRLFETPVGFKWFVDGLLDHSLSFACEESAGATFSRLDGSVWTTDKDGFVPALLSAEMTARSGRDPAALYRDLTGDLGAPAAERVEAPATVEQKQALAQLTAQQIGISVLAGEPIDKVLDRAPGNGAPIGGIKVVSRDGWFAVRPSGTEDIYKIYAESFRDEAHMRRIIAEAQALVARVLRDT